MKRVQKDMRAKGYTGIVVEGEGEDDAALVAWYRSVQGALWDQSRWQGACLHFTHAHARTYNAHRVTLWVVFTPVSHCHSMHIILQPCSSPCSGH